MIRVLIDKQRILFSEVWDGVHNRTNTKTLGSKYKNALRTSIHYVSGSRKRDLMEQIKKIEFFMLIKSYNLSQLSAKILEGKAFDVQRNWQLNWAVFSKAIGLEIKIT